MGCREIKSKSAVLVQIVRQKQAKAFDVGHTERRLWLTVPAQHPYSFRYKSTPSRHPAEQVGTPPAKPCAVAAKYGFLGEFSVAFPDGV